MSVRRDRPVRLELDDLAPDVRAAVEALIADGDVEVRRSDEPVGTLTFRPAVLSGAVLPPQPDATPTTAPGREGVKIVATTMLMSEAARRRLSDAFGPDFVVLDFQDAPATADIVLTQPVSPQLINRWTLLFPGAQILVTEILDPELGLDVRGSVGRLLDAGAHVYLPPRPVEQVAQNVRGYLASQAAGPELESGAAAPSELGTSAG